MSSPAHFYVEKRYCGIFRAVVFLFFLNDLFFIYLQVKYLTFEPDIGAFNNKRLHFETTILFALVTGRTMVRRLYIRD